MYTHSLWGTSGRREHLNSTKKFWCKCERCVDPTEFGTNVKNLRLHKKVFDDLIAQN